MDEEAKNLGEKMARPNRRDGKLKAHTSPLILLIRGQRRD